MSFQSLHDGLPYLVHIGAFSVMVNAPLFTHLAAVESIVPLHCIVLSLPVFFARFTSCFYILCFSSSLAPINYSVPAYDFRRAFMACTRVLAPALMHRVLSYCPGSLGLSPSQNQCLSFPQATTRTESFSLTVVRSSPIPHMSL